MFCNFPIDHIKLCSRRLLRLGGCREREKGRRGGQLIVSPGREEEGRGRMPTSYPDFPTKIIIIKNSSHSKSTKNKGENAQLFFKKKLPLFFYLFVCF